MNTEIKVKVLTVSSLRKVHSNHDLEALMPTTSSQGLLEMFSAVCSLSRGFLVDVFLFGYRGRKFLLGVAVKDSIGFGLISPRVYLK